MSSQKVLKLASDFAQRFNECWEKTGKPKIGYPKTPDRLTADWNGDRELRDQILASSLTDDQKQAMVKCLDLCIEEKESLLSRYKESTFNKSIVQEYRKAIATVTGNDPQDYNVTPLAFFTPNRYNLVVSNEKARKDLFKDRIPLSPKVKDDLLLKAIAIIEGTESTGAIGKDIYAKAISLELLTGRRCYSEILTYAEFRPYSDHEVIFTGQAKGDLEKRQREYIIPVLAIAPDKAVKALKEVRDYIQSRPWYSPDLAPSKIKRKTDSQIDLAINRHYLSLFTPLYLDGYKFSVSSHVFRKIYATICHQTLAPEKPFLQYAASILGHDYVSKTGQVLSSTVASQHYDMFYLTGT